jgi:hypothetical protein
MGSPYILVQGCLHERVHDTRIACHRSFRAERPYYPCQVSKLGSIAERALRIGLSGLCDHDRFIVRKRADLKRRAQPSMDKSWQC